MGQRAARALLTVLVPRGMMKKRMWLCQSGGLLLSSSTYGRSIELRKESEPQSPTYEPEIVLLEHSPNRK